MIVTDCEKAIQATDSVQRDVVRSILHNKIRSFVYRPNPQHENFQRIARKLRNDKDIAIMQTDKTNRIAVLNREDYLEKMSNCINNMDCIPLNKDPYFSLTQIKAF